MICGIIIIVIVIIIIIIIIGVAVLIVSESCDSVCNNLMLLPLLSEFHVCAYASGEPCSLYCPLLFFFCILSYISQVNLFLGWDFCIYDHVLIQSQRESHSVFVDGACWECFCCWYSPIKDMDVRIFGVRMVECICAQTRPQFILSSERVLGEWSQNPC